MSTGTGTLRTGEAAALPGVNIETLRYYERRGLIREAARRSSGHRYTPDDVRLVRAVKAAQGLGFTLAEVAEIVASPAGEAAGTRRAFASGWRPSWPRSRSASARLSRCARTCRR